MADGAADDVPNDAIDDAPMAAARWNRLMALFDEARARHGADRAGFLDAACGDDAALRTEVESLVAADADASGFLEQPAAAAVHAVMVARGAVPPAPIAPTGGPHVRDRVAAALGDAYRVERELGGGGMSRVFVAEETQLGRRVVVKVLPPELGAALDVERFRREVRLLATMRHPHIVPVLAAGESPGVAGGMLYYTMPYIEGESLRQRLDRDGPLPPSDVVRIVREVADALAYAHGRGVVHRDVKPANILVDGAHVVVSDFGIAKAISAATRPDDASPAEASGDASLTGRGLIVGTPSYMSPEQARGDADVDARSDVYALGCVAHELLAGERPATPYGPHAAVPAAAHAVIARALARRPDDRFATAGAFTEAFAGALAAPSAGVPRPMHRSRARLGVALVAVVLVVAAVVAAGVARARLVAGRAAPQPPTLAVVPFRNVGAPEDAYFAAGIAEEIATRLSRASGLRVIAWTSTAPLGTRAPADAGRAVGAGYVLEGSVRWQRGVGGAAEPARVVSRLVRVADGTQVWSDAYDVGGDPIGVQRTVAERVAEALDVRLAGAERAVLARGTRSAAAYDAFLRGNAMRARPLRYARSARLAAVQDYARAVALDSTFAAAWARLSRAQRRAYEFGDDASPAALDRARTAAARALALDSTLADANLAVGELSDRPWQSAERYLAALRTNPSNVELYWAVGNAQTALGLRDDALASYRRAVALDPRNPDWYAALAELHDVRHEFGDAVRVRARQIAYDSTNGVTFLAQALSYVNWRGDTAAARRVLARGVAAAGRPLLVQALARRSGTRALRALWPALDAETVHAIDTLSVAGAQGMPWGVHELKGETLQRRGLGAPARAQFDSARVAALVALRSHADDARLHEALALALAALGARDSALASARRALALDTAAADAGVREWLRFSLARVAAHVGDVDAALAALATGLPDETPVVTPYWLRLDPVWAPLWGDARFVRLAAAPRH